MNLGNVFEISAAILASVGGAGAIIFGLSTFLGKVWATRLMDAERHENKKELTLLLEGIRNKNNQELEKLKSSIESSSHVLKLDIDHEYDQRKKIKEVISKNKIRVMDSAEELNHRMWNFNASHEEKWHVYDNNKSIDEQYYLYSFVYRILVFFSWCDVTEREMIYLDSTVSSEKDLYFVKFIKVLPQVMCDTALFDGLDYDHSHDTDHFFKNIFHTVIEQMQSSEGVISFDEFKKKIIAKEIDVEKVVVFVSGISPCESRLRWYRLQAMHYVLLMFINSFGYDFQYTECSKVMKLKEMQKQNETLKNLEMILSKIMLQENKEVNLILKALNS